MPDPKPLTIDPVEIERFTGNLSLEVILLRSQVKALLAEVKKLTEKPHDPA